MKKGILIVFGALLLSSCSVGNKSQANPQEVVSENLLERVDLQFDQFPVALKTLALDLAPEAYTKVFADLKTDREKYTLTALAEQVAHINKAEQETKKFESFFVEASKSGFDWTKAAAIRGLGHTANMEQMHYLIGFLDADNPVVVDEALVALKVVFDRQKVETTRSPASSANDVYTIQDASFWKKWSKNNR